MTGEPITVERRPRTYILIGLAALIVAGIAVGAYLYTTRAVTPSPAAAALGTAPPTHTILGSIRLDIVAPGWETGAPCQTSNVTKGRGYQDIADGAQVTVTDPAGKVVALGKLGPGVVTPHPSIDGAKTCLFSLRITNVPTGLASYGIEITHRGRIQYREADLAGNIDFKLG